MAWALCATISPRLSKRPSPMRDAGPASDTAACTAPVSSKIGAAIQRRPMENSSLSIENPLWRHGLPRKPGDNGGHRHRHRLRQAGRAIRPDLRRPRLGLRRVYLGRFPRKNADITSRMWGHLRPAVSLNLKRVRDPRLDFNRLEWPQAGFAVHRARSEPLRRKGGPRELPRQSRNDSAGHLWRTAPGVPGFGRSSAS